MRRVDDKDKTKQWKATKSSVICRRHFRDCDYYDERDDTDMNLKLLLFLTESTYTNQSTDSAERNPSKCPKISIFDLNQP